MIWQDLPQLSLVSVLLLVAVFYWVMVAGYWVLQAYKESKSGKSLLSLVAVFYLVMFAGYR